MSELKIVSVADFNKEYQNDVVTYAVSGFDLVVTLKDGTTLKIEDGVSKALLGEFELKIDDNPISNQELISGIRSVTLDLDGIEYLTNEQHEIDENNIGGQQSNSGTPYDIKALNKDQTTNEVKEQELREQDQAVAVSRAIKDKIEEQQSKRNQQELEAQAQKGEKSQEAAYVEVEERPLNLFSSPLNREAPPVIPTESSDQVGQFSNQETRDGNDPINRPLYVTLEMEKTIASLYPTGEAIPYYTSSRFPTYEGKTFGGAEITFTISQTIHNPQDPTIAPTKKEYTFKAQADELGNWSIPEAELRKILPPSGLADGQYEVKVVANYVNEGTAEEVSIVQPLFITNEQISQEGFSVDLSFAKEYDYRIYKSGQGIFDGKDPSKQIVNIDPYSDKGLSDNTLLINKQNFVISGTVKPGLQVTVIDRYPNPNYKEGEENSNEPQFIEKRYQAKVVGVEEKYIDEKGNEATRITGQWSVEISDFKSDVEHSFTYQISDYKGNTIDYKDVSSIPKDELNYSDAQLNSLPVYSNNIYLDASKPLIENVDLADPATDDTGSSQTDRITYITTPTLKATISTNLLSSGGSLFLIAGNRKSEIKKENIIVDEEATKKLQEMDPEGNAGKQVVTIIPPAFQEGSYKWYLQAVSVTGVEVNSQPELDITIDTTIEKPNVDLTQDSDTIAGKYDSTTHFGYANEDDLKKFEGDNLTSQKKPKIDLGNPEKGNSFVFVLKNKDTGEIIATINTTELSAGLAPEPESAGTISRNQTGVGYIFTPTDDLTAGNYEYSVNISDVAGNSSKQIGNFEITEAPKIDIKVSDSIDGNNTLTTASNPNLEGAFPANSQVTIVFGKKGGEPERIKQFLTGKNGSFSIPFFDEEGKSLNVGESYSYTVYVTTPEGHQVSQSLTLTRQQNDAKSADIEDIKLYYKDENNVEKANLSIAATNLKGDLSSVNDEKKTDIAFKLIANLKSGGSLISQNGTVTVKISSPNGEVLEIEGVIKEGKIIVEKTLAEINALKWKKTETQSDGTTKEIEVTHNPPIPDSLYNYEIIPKLENNDIKIKSVLNQMLIDRVPPTIDMVAGKNEANGSFSQVGESFYKSNGQHKIMTSVLKPVFSGKTEGYANVKIVIKKPDGSIFATIETRANASGDYSVESPNTFPNPAINYQYEITATDLAGNSNTKSGQISVNNINYSQPQHNIYWYGSREASENNDDGRKYATGANVTEYIFTRFNNSNTVHFGQDSDNGIVRGWIIYKERNEKKINDEDEDNSSTYTIAGFVSPLNDGFLFSLPPEVLKQATTSRNKDNPSGTSYTLQVRSKLVDKFGNITPEKIDTLVWSSLRPLINTRILGVWKSQVIDRYNYGYDHIYKNANRTNNRVESKPVNDPETGTSVQTTVKLPDFAITNVNPILRIEIPVPDIYQFSHLSYYDVTIRFNGNTITKRLNADNIIKNNTTISGQNSYRWDLNLAKLEGKSALNTGTYVYSIQVKDSLGNEFTRSETLEIVDVPFYIHELDNTGDLSTKSTSVNKGLRIVANNETAHELIGAQLVIKRKDGKAIAADSKNNKIPGADNVVYNAANKSLTYTLKQNTDPNDKRWMAHLGQNIDLKDGRYVGTLTRTYKGSDGKTYTNTSTEEFVIDTTPPLIRKLNPNTTFFDTNSFIYRKYDGNKDDKSEFSGRLITINFIFDAKGGLNLLAGNKSISLNTEPGARISLELFDPISGIKETYTTVANSNGVAIINGIQLLSRIDPTTGINVVYSGKILVSDNANNSTAYEVKIQQSLKPATPRNVTDVWIRNTVKDYDGDNDVYFSFGDDLVNPRDLTGEEREQWYKSHFKSQDFFSKGEGNIHYIPKNKEGKYVIHVWSDLPGAYYRHGGEGVEARFNNRGYRKLEFNSLDELNGVVNLKGTSRKFTPFFKQSNKDNGNGNADDNYILYSYSSQAENKITNFADAATAKNAAAKVATTIEVVSSNPYNESSTTYKATGTSRPIITGKATPLTIIKVVITNIEDSSKTFTRTATVNKSGDYRVDFSGVENGKYSIKAINLSTDNSTEINEASEKLLINTNIAEVESNFQDENGKDLASYVDVFTLSNQSNVKIKATVKNAISLWLHVIKSNDKDNKFETINKQLTIQNGNIEDSLDSLDNGEYVVTLTAINTTGIKTVVTKYLIVNKDAIQNTVDGLADSYLERSTGEDSKTKQVTPFDEVAITGKINKPFSTISLTIGNNLSPLKTIADNDGNWTILIPAVYIVPGTNSYKVNAVDLNGNKAEEITKEFISNKIEPISTFYVGVKEGKAFDNKIENLKNGFDNKDPTKSIEGKLFVEKNGEDYDINSQVINPNGPSASVESVGSSVLPTYRINGSRIKLGGKVIQQGSEEEKPINNAKVTIQIRAGSKIETFVVYSNDKGEWEFNDTQDRVDGVYDYNVKYETSYGIKANKAITGSVQLKNFVNIINDGLTRETDTTPFNDDHFKTGYRKPVIHGKVDSDATVQISFDGGDTWESVIVDPSNGSWSFNVASSTVLNSQGRVSEGEVSVGTIKYFLRAVDKLSNVSLIRGEVVVTDQGSLEVHVVPGKTRDLTQNGYPIFKSSDIGEVNQAFKINYKANSRVKIEIFDINGNLIVTRTESVGSNGIRYLNFIPSGINLTKSGLYSYKVSEANDPEVYTEGKFLYSINNNYTINAKLLETTDTGVLGDNVTSNQSPIITGSAIPGALIKLEITIDGITVVLTTIAGAEDGKYVIQLPKLTVTPGTSKEFNYKITATTISGDGKVENKLENQKLTINLQEKTFSIGEETITSSGTGNRVINYKLNVSDATSSTVTANIYEFNLSTGKYDKFVRSISQVNSGNSNLTFKIEESKYGLSNSSYIIRFNAQDSAGNDMIVATVPPATGSSKIKEVEKTITTLTIGIQVPNNTGEFVDNVWYTQGNQDVVGSIFASNQQSTTVSLVVSGPAAKIFTLTKTLAAKETAYKFSNEEIIQAMGGGSGLTTGAWEFRTFIGAVDPTTGRPLNSNSAMVSRSVYVQPVAAEFEDYNFIIDPTTVQTSDDNKLDIATGGKTTLVGKLTQGLAKVLVYYTDISNKDKLSANLDPHNLPEGVKVKEVYSYDGHGSFITELNFDRGTYAIKLVPVSLSGKVGKASSIGTIDVASETPILTADEETSDITENKKLKGSDNTANVYLKLNTSATVVTKVYGIDATGKKTLIYTSNKQSVTSEQIKQAELNKLNYNFIVDISRAVLDSSYPNFEYEITATNPFGVATTISSKFSIEAASFNVTGGLVDDGSSSGITDLSNIVGFSKLSSVTTSTKPKLTGTGAPGATVTIKIYEGAETGDPIQTITATVDALTSIWNASATSELAEGRYTFVVSQTGNAATVGQTAKFVVDVSTGAAESVPRSTVLVSSNIEDTNIVPKAVPADKNDHNEFSKAVDIGSTNSTNNLWISGQLGSTTSSNAVVTLLDSEGNVIGNSYLVTKSADGRWMFKLPSDKLKEGVNYYKVETVTTGGKLSESAKFFKFNIDKTAPNLNDNKLTAEKSEFASETGYDKPVEEVKEIKFSTNLADDVVKVKIVIQSSGDDASAVKYFEQEFTVTAGNKNFTANIDKTLLPQTNTATELTFKVTAFDAVGNSKTYVSNFKLSGVNVEKPISDGFNELTEKAASAYDELSTTKVFDEEN